MKFYNVISCLLLCIATNSVSAALHISPATKFPNQSYLIADSNGNIIDEHSSFVTRPIASISKLMVALLASTQDMDEALIIPSHRTVQSAIPQKQTTMSRRELLRLALIKSDNFAAQILCYNIPDCVNAMNAKAVELGMTRTRYVEPTGLSEENVSTAQDLLKLMMVASTVPTITNISSLPSADIQTGKSTFKIRNTNPLTNTLDIILSKTGFTDPAGGCLVMLVNSPVGQRFMILLGSRNAQTRIPDMVRLYKNMQ